MAEQMKLSFLTTTASKIDELPIVDGQFILIKDINTIAVDMNDKRTKYEQIITLASDSDRSSILAPVNGIFYFVVETNSLWKYDQEWQMICSAQSLVPAGGSSGQVLTKQSDTNGDVSWQNPSVSDEQVTTAVNLYLEENPVSGMTAEQELQLDENTKKMKYNLPVGKNLLDPNMLIKNGNGNINPNTGEIIDGTLWVFDYIALEVGKEYTVSKSSSTVGLFFYDYNGNFYVTDNVVITPGTTEKTFIANHPICKVVAYSKIDEMQLQIEKGAVATEYEPYQVTIGENVIIPDLDDIKLGYNGEEYSSPGEAVREQAKKVIDEIDNTNKDMSRYLSIGKNLIDPSKLIKDGDGMIDSLTGEIKSGACWVFDFIKLDVEKTYTLSNKDLTTQLFFYNNDGTYTSYQTIISAQANNRVKTFVAEYPLVRILSYGKVDIISAQLEPGDMATEYESFRLVLKEDVDVLNPDVQSRLLGDKNVQNKNIAEKSIGLTKTNFSTGTYNMLNPDTCEEGYLNSSGTGLNISTSFFTSDYIEIGETDKVVRFLQSVYSICFYDSGKSLLEKTPNDFHQNSYTIPDGSKYLRVSFLGFISNVNNYCVYFGNKEKSFIPYNVVRTDYIEKEESPFPDVKIVMTKDIVLSNKVDICINHQSVIKNFDIKRSVISGNIQQNKFPTYDNITVLSGGSVSDGIIKFIHQPNYQIGMLTKDFHIINVDESAGAEQEKTILFIGDSKTDANEYTQYLLDMFESDPMNIKLIGTRGSGNNKHEGRSGWSAENYVENNAWRGVIEESPFWNPQTEQFDFVYYMEHNSYDHVDYVFINLGTNDTYDNFIEYYHKMIDGIREYDPNILIAMWVPAPFATFGGYTHRDNDNQTFKMMEAIINEFDTDEYQSQKIFVVPTHMNINTYYDFKWKDVKINNSTEETYRVCTDQIHESNGYEHVAEVIYGYIKYFATLN